MVADNRDSEAVLSTGIVARRYGLKVARRYGLKVGGCLEPDGRLDKAPDSRKTIEIPVWGKNTQRLETLINRSTTLRKSEAGPCAKRPSTIPSAAWILFHSSPN